MNKLATMIAVLLISLSSFAGEKSFSEKSEFENIRAGESCTNDR